MERDRRLALRDPRRRVEDWRRVVVEVRACGSDDLARPRLLARVARDGPEQRPPIRRRGASARCPGGRNSIWRVRRNHAAPSLGQAPAVRARWRRSARPAHAARGAQRFVHPRWTAEGRQTRRRPRAPGPPWRGLSVATPPGSGSPRRLSRPPLRGRANARSLACTRDTRKVRMDGGICKPPTVVDVRLRQLERRRDPRRLFPDGVLRHHGERFPLPMGRASSRWAGPWPRRAPGRGEPFDRREIHQARLTPPSRSCSLPDWDHG